MALKYIGSVMKASLYLFTCWLRNNRALAFMMVLWPYMMAFFLLGLGTILGSIEEYSSRMGVANPIFYILASSSIMVSSINIVDTVAGDLLRHRWIGTLPYIVSSPPRFIVYAIAGPIPSTMITGLISLTSILPAAVYFEGALGGLKILLVLGLVYLAMLPLIGIAVIVGGFSLIVAEETNIASFLTPFILLVSGVFYPQYVLPTVLQWIGRAFPLVYVVEATRVLATYHIPPLQPILTAVAFLAGLSILYNTLAFPGLLYVEEKLRRTGAYEE